MYRLNLIVLCEIANEIDKEKAKLYCKRWIFSGDYGYGTEIPCELCDKHDECMSKYDDEIVEYGLEVNQYPGVKFCLRDNNVLCHEDCYDDQSFCEQIVFLGYPEEKIKYPTAYTINSLPKWAIGR